MLIVFRFWNTFIFPFANVPWRQKPYKETVTDERRECTLQWYKTDFHIFNLWFFSFMWDKYLFRILWNRYIKGGV
jgi:hypothetical protein